MAKLCLVPVSDVEFKEGEKEHIVEVQILYDGQREMREAFTVHMKPDEYMVAEIQVRAAGLDLPVHQLIQKGSLKIKSQPWIFGQKA